MGYHKRFRSVTANTIRGYLTDISTIKRWCSENGASTDLPLSEETAICFFDHLAKQGKSRGTLVRAWSALNYFHRQHGHAELKSDDFAKAFWDIASPLAHNRLRKLPIGRHEMERMMDTLRYDMIGKRDRAILTMLFTGLFQRSQLAALDYSDLLFHPNGSIYAPVLGQGKHIALEPDRDTELRADTAMRVWLIDSGIKSGPVFRYVNRHGNVQPGRLSTNAIAIVVKRAMESAGFDPSRYSTSSFRNGYYKGRGAIGRRISRAEYLTQKDTSSRGLAL